MRGFAVAVLIACIGCDKKEGPAPLVPPTPPSVKPKSGSPPPPPPLLPPTRLPRADAPPPPRPPPSQNPKTVPEGEPERIVVQHVLVAFKGSLRAPQTVTRTRDEAEKLAEEVLQRARDGEDIKELAKKYSTDPGGGLYTLVNWGVTLKTGEIPRAQFIKAFVDVAFKLHVGDVGIVRYDREKSPFGWHVIKRLE